MTLALLAFWLGGFVVGSCSPFGTLFEVTMRWLGNWILEKTQDWIAFLKDEDDD